MYVPRRYLVSVASWLVLASCYFFRTNMSIAILGMFSSPNKLQKYGLANSTDHGNKYECPDTKDPSSPTSFIPATVLPDNQQSYLISAYFYGYFMTNFFGCIMDILIGPRWTMIIALVGASFFTFLTVPAFYVQGNRFALIFICRFMIGLFCGPLYACMHAILANWAPKSERTAMTVITHSGNIIGLVITFVSGIMVGQSPKGWEYYMYLSGSLGILSLILWVIFAYDHPYTHPYISTKEKDYIVNDLYPDGIPPHESLKEIPFKSIFLTKHVYLTGIAHMGNNYILYIFLTGLPKYLKTVHHFSPQKSSLISIIPFLTNFIFQIISSTSTQALQRKYKKSVTFYRKTNSIIGFFMACLSLMPAGFFPCNQFIGSMILLSFGMGFIAFNQSGFFTAMIDLGPKYSSITMGICNTIGSISGFVNPTMVVALTDTYGYYFGWRYSFLITGIVTLLCGLLWLVFGTCEDQGWSHQHSNHNSKRKESPPPIEIKDTLHEDSA